MIARSVALALLLAAMTTVPADAAKKVRHPRRIAPAAKAAPATSPSDDLYRRRGFGQGGLVFGGRQGGTALAGACADVAFARPLSCEPGGGYGLYGNGLGYPFGF